MTKPFIRKVLDISTGHITFQDNEILGGDNTVIACEPVEAGFFVYLGTGSEALEHIQDVNEAGNMSPAFINILRWAVMVGCDIIKIDRDGELYEGLPTFEW
jgi:hypothetical protein